MFVDNEQFNENYRGYNPAFVRRVREKQKAERQMQAMERRRQAAEEAKLQREVARVKAMQEAARQLAEERSGEDEAKARVSAILSQYREVEQTKGKKSVRQIILETAIKHGVTEGEIKGPRRSVKLVLARHEAMYRARKERPDLSYPQIGREFGGRDHTTVLHGVRTHEARVTAA